MNAKKFDQIVENRSIERTRARIIKFEQTVHAAVAQLYHDGSNPYHARSFFTEDKRWPAIVEALNTNKWPKELWDQERKLVTDELLGTLDEMARALIAPPPSADGPLPPQETPANA